MIKHLRLCLLLVLFAAGLRQATATPNDEHTWALRGLSEVYDPFLWQPFGMKGDTWEVRIAESEENPGVYKIYDIYTTCPSVLDGSFALINPEKGSYMVIDARETENVQVIEFALNVKDTSYGYYEFEQRTSGTFKNGIIRFPVGAIHFGLEEVNLNTKGYYNTVPYEIKLPDAPDGSVALSNVSGLCGTDNKVTFDISKGKDAKGLKIAVFEGKHDPNSADFDLYSRTVESGKDVEEGPYELNLPHKGWQTAVIISTDENGDWAAGTTHYFFSSDYNPDEWTSLGMVDFQDDTFLPIFNVFDILDPWKVELLESKTTPNYYRVLNPWDNYPEPDILDGLVFHTGHNHYFDLDATYHPMMVAIPETPMGVSIEGNEMTISHIFRGNMLNDHQFKFRQDGVACTIGDRNFTANQEGVFSISIPENYFLRNLMFTVKNSDNALLTGAEFKVAGAAGASAVTDAKGYADFFLGGLDGTTREVEILLDGYEPYRFTVPFENEVEIIETVVLKTNSGVNGIEVNAGNESLKYYNLQGIEIEKPSQGVYIERRGNKVTKIIR